MWAGEFHYGQAWAAYRGQAGDNSRHKHTTMQIVVSTGTPALIEGADGAQTGHALLVRPGVPHRLAPIGKVLIAFLEPQTPEAALVNAHAGDGGVTALPAAILSLIDPDAPIASCLAPLSAAVPARTVAEARIQEALAFLAEDQGPRAVARAAETAGVSAPRLRALAKDHLGVPMTTWLAWRRLERAGQALSTGASLADAAYEAVFADQAHLSREMRKVFGVTLATAGRVMRNDERKVQDR